MWPPIWCIWSKSYKVNHICSNDMKDHILRPIHLKFQVTLPKGVWLFLRKVLKVKGMHPYIVSSLPIRLTPIELQNVGGKFFRWTYAPKRYEIIGLLYMSDPLWIARGWIWNISVSRHAKTSANEQKTRSKDGRALRRRRLRSLFRSLGGNTESKTTRCEKTASAWFH